MGYLGRICIPLLVVLIVAVWHTSYFLIGRHASYVFFITQGFLKYDFIYTPLMIPFFWWLGKKYDEVKFYSERDPLTSVYNRRYAIKVFPSLLENVDKYNRKLIIFVVDIDNFKNINDTYGHERGDRVIQDVCGALLAYTNKSDLVVRWGGDEFLVIVSDSDQLDKSLSSNIHHNLEVISKRLGVNISLSIGKSTYPENARALDDLIRIADEHMYQTKSRKCAESQLL